MTDERTIPDGRTASATDPSRRKILKTAGLGAGAMALGPGALGTVSAEDATTIGRTRFVEVGLEHEPVGASEFPRAALAHSDDFLDYRVDRENERLLLTRIVDDETVRMFRSSDSVAKADSFRPLPASLLDGRSDDLLTVTVGRDVAPTRQLRVEGGYQTPVVSVRGRGGTLDVSTGTTTASVRAGDRSRIELEPRTVAVPRPTDSFRAVEDPRRGATMRRREYETAELSVVPVVTVRDHGQLDVHRLEGGE